MRSVPPLELITPASCVIGGRTFALGDETYIMGALNTSPESPNKESIVTSVPAAVQRARELIDDGADIIDVGGRSSHYAAAAVSVDEECRRVVPVVEALKGIGAIVSVDTWNASVVREAAAAGLDLVNDAEGFQAPEMIEAVASSGLPVVVPFIDATTPQQLDGDGLADPIAAMLEWFADAVARLDAAGVQGAILDPGTSFSRQRMTPAQKDAFQRAVFARLGELRRFGRPVLAPLPKRDARSEVAAFADMLVAARTDFVRTYAPRFVTQAKARRRGDRAGHGER